MSVVGCIHSIQVHTCKNTHPNRQHCRNEISTHIEEYKVICCGKGRAMLNAGGS